MKGEYKMYKDVFEKFEEYLEIRGYSKFTPKGLPSTTYDYAKVRIPYILKVEKIGIDELVGDIDHYISLYDLNGAKEILGNKSHRAVINALKRFKEFFNSEYYNE